MEMVGQARLGASRELVWDSLNDPAVLQASIPGCESLERTDANAFTATVVSSVGPIKARFTGKVTLSNIVAPRSYTLTGEGSGGAAGFAKADIEVVLDALEPQVTLLRYTVKANVGGKLAQLGSRMVDVAARKSADDFFNLFGAQIEARTGSEAPAATNAVLDLAGLAGQVGAPEPGGAAAPIAAAVVPKATPADTPAETELSQPQPVTAEPVSTSEAMDVLTAELIKVWISDQIAVVTLNRPGSRNAMTYAMWRAIPTIFAALERNAEVRAVILTGGGTDFCAGADISEFQKVRDDTSKATAYEVAVDACCDAIARIAKPTIAVLRGYCLGGGAHLAMSCDFRYAAPDAMFGIPAARLSIIYGVRGTRKLLSLVGLAQAKKILYGAQRFDAREALKIGFVDQVAGDGAVEPPSIWSRLMGGAKVAPVVDPMADARAYARSLADNAPLSIAGAKALLNGMAMGTGALDLRLADALIDAASNSHDYREGRAAFAEKRAPQFLGR